MNPLRHWHHSTQCRVEHDVLSFRTETLSIGHTSMKVKVCVDAQRFDDPGNIVPVTEATLVFVAVDDNRRPVPLNVD